MKNLSTFVSHYIACALWSSNEYPHGECPHCGKTAILLGTHEDHEDETVCDDCKMEDANPEPMEDNYSVEDFAEKTLEEIVSDCEDFQTANATLLDESGLSLEQAAHDFWLTRNGHGAGFWDRGLGEVGRKLSDAAKVYGECNLYVGDDGKIYI